MTTPSTQSANRHQENYPAPPVVDLGYGGVRTADVMSRNEASTSLHWRECAELRISVNGKRTEHNLYIQQTITDDHVKRKVRNESRSVCVLNRYSDGGV